MKLTKDTQRLLCCPICKSTLILVDQRFECTNTKCNAHFPIVNGIPVLINEQSSLFSIEDFTNGRETTRKLSQSKVKKALSKVIPKISLNVKANANYEKFVRLMFRQNEKPRVMIVGCGSIVGQGLQALLSHQSLEVIESDVSFGPHTALICDAHDIPFEDNSLDGLIIQAVLEHVVDPYRCVEEIHRVLKGNGLVYAETPFMQQVHMGRYDFTRFTHLGHRRLFREFEEIASGATCGPGMALAWSYQYFLMSFVKSNAARRIVQRFARMTSFWLKYFDFYLIDKPGSLDAASGYYFMGRKNSQFLSDRELIKLYRGNLG